MLTSSNEKWISNEVDTVFTMSALVGYYRVIYLRSFLTINYETSRIMYALYMPLFVGFGSKKFTIAK